MRANRGLRLPRHRATTAHLCAAYPFQTEPSGDGEGVFVGIDHLAGGGAFTFDPFTLYGQGVLTNPNVLILGEQGEGKSLLVKILLRRSLAVLGPGRRRRWAAVCDPKGEYGGLADAVGLRRICLRPGGTARLNPLDPGPLAAFGGSDELAARRTALVAALLATVLRRELSPFEDAAVGAAVLQLGARRGNRVATLADIATLLASPTEEMARRVGSRPDAVASGAEAARHALGKLLDRELRGMFDGRSTERTDWSARGVVVDLSAVHHDRDALAVVMVAATAWLQALLAAPAEEETPLRFQVLDEAWALLGSERIARYLQRSWKLCRAYGVANVAVAHRVSDLRAQADDGTATAKVAMGLLADTQTKVLFRQAPDEVPGARSLLGLTESEARLLSRLSRMRALWKVGDRAAVVEQLVAPGEWALCDTDQRMAA